MATTAVPATPAVASNGVAISGEPARESEHSGADGHAAGPKGGDSAPCGSGGGDQREAEGDDGANGKQSKQSSSSTSSDKSGSDLLASSGASQPTAPAADLALQQHQQMMWWWYMYAQSMSGYASAYGAHPQAGGGLPPHMSQRAGASFAPVPSGGASSNPSSTPSLVNGDTALVCNESGDSTLLARKKRGRSPEEYESIRKRSPPAERKACSNCATSNTPFWRKDKNGGQPLCNACGLYLAKNDAHRPKLLWKQQQAEGGGIVPSLEGQACAGGGR